MDKLSATGAKSAEESDEDKLESILSFRVLVLVLVLCFGSGSGSRWRDFRFRFRAH